MPTVTIRIPQVLRHHTAGARSVDVEAGAVHEALEALFAVYPSLRESLTPPSGNVLEATNLFLNERDVATLDGLASTLASGDTLTILPAMSGGGRSGRLVASSEGLCKHVGTIDMARGIFVGAIAAVLLAVSSACSEAPEAIRMGIEGAYPPYNFINDAGEIDGFDRELGDEICRRANLECTWVINEWDTIIPNLVAGQYDTIVAGMSITQKRDEIIDFTQPYLPPGASVYLAAAGAGDEAINGKVAAQGATVQADYLASQSGATLLEYELVPKAIAAVLSGEADAALVDLKVAHKSLAEHEGMLAIVGPEVKLDLGIGIGVREDDGELKDKLDQAITDMKGDGSLNVLIAKWFGDEVDGF
ncbi:MAG: transporter substrate-binding domain-containing protein [Chloroflexi bacterium]|nr:transporter substrate-binding domain-containing protein [Chloroflexota bacterium]